MIIRSLLFLAVFGLVACEPVDRYPVSGEACAPDDPVKELDAIDCAPPA